MIRIETLSNGTRRVGTVPGWAVGLGVLAAGALGLVVLAVGAGIALLLAPVIVGAAALARWRLRKALREAGFQDASFARPDRASPASSAGVIDAEYRVVDERRP